MAYGSRVSVLKEFRTISRACVEGLEVPQGQRLHDHVANGRGVGGRDDQGPPHRVGGEVAQQGIGRSVQEVEPRDLAPGKVLNLLERLAVEQGEAFQDTTNDRAGLARHGLAGFPGRRPGSSAACRPAPGSAGRRD